MYQTWVSPVWVLYQTMSALRSLFMSAAPTILNGGPMRAALPSGLSTVPRLERRLAFMYQTWVSPVWVLYQTMSALRSPSMSAVATILNGGPMNAGRPFSSSTVARLTRRCPFMCQIWVSPVEELYRTMPWRGELDGHDHLVVGAQLGLDVVTGERRLLARHQGGPHVHQRGLLVDHHAGTGDAGVHAVALAVLHRQVLLQVDGELGHEQTPLGVVGQRLEGEGVGAADGRPPRRVRPGLMACNRASAGREWRSPGPSGTRRCRCTDSCRPPCFR